ncbi:hypothetical protein ACLOJK_002315 [Asimina triloba]
MITPKKLLEMARKGQKVAAHRSRRNSLSSDDDAADSSGCSSTSVAVADKGHFVVYAVDGVRFVLPLACLDSPIFVQLFRMSEDEFGLPSAGPIVLPCAGDFLEYAVSLIQRRMSKVVEKALLTSMASGQCSRSTALQHGGGFSNQLRLLEGFC